MAAADEICDGRDSTQGEHGLGLRTRPRRHCRPESAARRPLPQVSIPSAPTNGGGGGPSPSVDRKTGMVLATVCRQAMPAATDFARSSADIAAIDAAWAVFSAPAREEAPLDACWGAFGVYRAWYYHHSSVCDVSRNSVTSERLE